MGVKSKIKLEKDALILSANIKKEELLFSVPPKIQIIKFAGIKIMDGLIDPIKKQILAILSSLSLKDLTSLGLGFLFDQLDTSKNKDTGDKEREVKTNPINIKIDISDQDLLDAVKTNPDLAAINRYIAQDFSSKMADELTVACNNGDFENNTIKKLENLLDKKKFSGTDFINIIQSNSNFDDIIDAELKTIKNNDAPNNAINNLLNSLGTLLSVLLLLFNLYMLIREFIVSNRFPSQFRGRMLGSIVRTFCSPSTRFWLLVRTFWFTSSFDQHVYRHIPIHRLFRLLF